VFLLSPYGKVQSYCLGFEEVFALYNEVTPTLKLHGPTNFAPSIEKAIQIFKEQNESILHILMIITDSDVPNSKRKETYEAIVNASSYPLSIIVIGVGNIEKN
jgi:E3 ubiquitin-protein ligase RGLG